MLENTRFGTENLSENQKNTRKTNATNFVYDILWSEDFYVMRYWYVTDRQTVIQTDRTTYISDGGNSK